MNNLTAFDAYVEPPVEAPKHSANQSRLPQLISVAALVLLWGIAAINTTRAALIVLGLI